MNSDRDTLAGGLPHSEIPGSPIARISPGLFAACHVLHRLSVPRHPPDALLRLFTGLSQRRDRTTAAHRAKPHALPPPRRRRPAPHQRETAVSHEDTSRTDPVPETRACPPRSHHQRSLHPSINHGARFAGAADRALPRTPPLTPPDRRWRLLAQRDRPSQGSSVVEVNGLEPMTSCLQSRRSPS
jgi:hypothetical protein